MKYLIALALLAGPCFGAIAFVAGADLGNNGGSTSSLTTSYAVGSGANRLLAIGCAGDSTADLITGATYNGASMTLAAKKTPSPFGNRWNYLFYLVAPTSGAHNVVVSASGTTFILCGAADYTGMAQSGQPDATTTNAVGAASITTTLTVATANSWTVLCMVGYNANAAQSAGAGSTQRATDATFATYGLYDSNAALSAASHSMTASYAGFVGNGINSVMASFKPVAASTTTSQAFIF